MLDRAVHGAGSAGHGAESEADTPRGADDAPPGAQDRLSSAGLADDQAQAAYGILTSGQAIDILVGPAGTGKTWTVAALARVWHETGAGRVIGLTTSTNAAHTLAAEGLEASHNFAAFLGRMASSDQTRGHLPVRPGDLLVIDEASMVSTADLAAVEAIATRCGAKILLTGDTGQLSAPQAGGALRLLAGEHGCYQLHTVQRFEQGWERAASLEQEFRDTPVKPKTSDTASNGGADAIEAAVSHLDAEIAKKHRELVLGRLDLVVGRVKRQAAEEKTASSVRRLLLWWRAVIAACARP